MRGSVVEALRNALHHSTTTSKKADITNWFFGRKEKGIALSNHYYSVGTEQFNSKRDQTKDQTKK